MTIPDFQTLMLPLLTLSGDSSFRRKSDYEEKLATLFQLSEDDRKETLKSGSPRFSNRVAWAIVYLRNAGLLNATARGFTEISADGKKLLLSPPERITIKFLEKYEKFREFRNRKSDSLEERISDSSKENSFDAPPNEIIDTAFKELNASLANEALEMVCRCSPRFLEHLVVKLVLAMGYGAEKLGLDNAGKVTEYTKDSGIDGIIYEDALGLDIIYLQAKKWDGKVGRPEIQKFVGALSGQKAKKGIFITTSSFTQEAIDYASYNEYRLILIDGAKLASLMVEYGVGVDTIITYAVKRINTDFFEDFLEASNA